MTKLTDDRRMTRVEVEGWLAHAKLTKSIQFITEHGPFTVPPSVLVRLCDLILSLMDEKEAGLAREMTDATTEALNQ